MADDQPEAMVPPPPPPVVARRRAWDGRWQRWLAGVIAACLLIVVGTLVWLDTAPGHRFLVSRIITIKPPSGLRIEVGRIDGSIYRKAVLHNLTLSDPKGRFLDAPTVELDWWPFAWLSNRAWSRCRISVMVMACPLWVTDYKGARRVFTLPLSPSH